MNESIEKFNKIGKNVENIKTEYNLKNKILQNKYSKNNHNSPHNDKNKKQELI